MKTYVMRVGIVAGVTLLCASPVVLVAVWQTGQRPWTVLALIGVLVVVENAISALPKAPALKPFERPWQAAVLTTALTVAAVWVIAGISWSSIGVTSALTPGWLAPAIAGLVIAAAVPAVVFTSGSRLRLTAEGWIYLLAMPGLAEELLYRGVYQSVLNDAFGRPWQLGGADWGWGLLITSVLFAAANGLVSIDDRQRVRVIGPRAIAPFLMSLVSGWVRERTNSVWPSVIGHNVSNLVIPIATVISRSSLRRTHPRPS